MPRMRWRLYSSCASSTWSLPAAEWACSAKMSRITRVRSTTRIAELVLERALLARRELVLGHDDLGLELLRELLQLLELAAADIGARVDAAAVLDERADHVDLRGAQQLEHLGELAILVGALREHGDEHGALGPCVVIDHLRTLAHGWSIRPQERRAGALRGRGRCARRPPRGAPPAP